MTVMLLIILYDVSILLTWLGAYIWILTLGTTVFAVYDGIHRNLILHFIATYRFIYLWESTAGFRIKWHNTIIFTAAAIFDILNILVIYLHVPASVSSTAWNLDLALSYLLSSSSLLMFIYVMIKVHGCVASVRYVSVSGK